MQYAVLEEGVCFGVLNGTEDQILQRKTTIRIIEVSLNILCDWLQARKHVKMSAHRHEII